MNIQYLKSFLKKCSNKNPFLFSTFARKQKRTMQPCSPNGKPWYKSFQYAALGMVIFVSYSMQVNATWQNISGWLKQVSVGSDGRVWGVSSQNEVYTREGVNGSWQKIQGWLKQVSAGSDGRVWGVSSQNGVYTRDGVNENWQQIYGQSLKQVSVGSDGRVWGVNSSDHIYTREGVNGSWQKVSAGWLKQISVGPNGNVWGVNSNNQIYYKSDSAIIVNSSNETNNSEYHTNFLVEGMGKEFSKSLNATIGSGTKQFGISGSLKAYGNLMKGDLVNMGGEANADITLFGKTAQQVIGHPVFKMEAKRGVTNQGDVISEGSTKFLGINLYYIKDANSKANGSGKKNHRYTKQDSTKLEQGKTEIKNRRSEDSENPDAPKKLLESAVQLLQAANDDELRQVSSAFSTFKTSRSCPSDASSYQVFTGLLLAEHTNCALFVDWNDVKNASKSSTHASTKLLKEIAEHYGSAQQKKWDRKDFVKALNKTLKKINKREKTKRLIRQGLAAASALTDLATEGLSLEPLIIPTDRISIVQNGMDVSTTFFVGPVPVEVSGGISADVGIGTELVLDHDENSTMDVTIHDDYTMQVPLPFGKPRVAIYPYASAGAYVGAGVNLGVSVGGVDISAMKAGIEGQITFIENEFKPSFEGDLYKDTKVTFKIDNQQKYLNGRLIAYAEYSQALSSLYQPDTDFIECASGYTRDGTTCSKWETVTKTVEKVINCITNPGGLYKQCI